MKCSPSFVLIIMLFGIWSCSDAGPVASNLGNECSIELDCAGVCGGSAVLSGCDNLCNSTTVKDCAGTCGGNALGNADNCTNISYSSTIQPIFDTHCTGCHGGQGGLFLDSYSNLISGNVISVGDSINSQLIKKLKGTPLGITQMPKGEDALDARIITLIATWVQEGALEN